MARSFVLSLLVNASFDRVIFPFFAYDSLFLAPLFMIRFSSVIMPKGSQSGGKGKGPKRKTTAKRPIPESSSEDEKPKRKRGASHKDQKLNQWPVENLLPCLEEYNE